MRGATRMTLVFVTGATLLLTAASLARAEDAGNAVTSTQLAGDGVQADATDATPYNGPAVRATADEQCVSTNPFGCSSDHSGWASTSYGSDSPSADAGPTSEDTGHAGGPDAMPNVAWHCSVYVSDLGGPSLAGNVDQICGGNYGVQWVEGQVARSSWRGWLGYGPWHETNATPADYSHLHVAERCNLNHGKYHYVLQGFGVNSHARSNLVRSVHQTTLTNCGPKRP